VYRLPIRFQLHASTRWLEAGASSVLIVRASVDGGLVGWGTGIVAVACDVGTAVEQGKPPPHACRKRIGKRGSNVYLAQGTAKSWARPGAVT